MKDGKTITLNYKSILLIGIIILTLAFALGFMTSNKRMEEKNITIFTREDLDRIGELQRLEDERKSGAEIYAYKDENGNLMIGWDYSDSKRK